MMSDNNLAPVCGLYCGACEFHGEQCRGCGYVKGKPFWTSQMKIDVCPLYSCCVNEKHLEHCGLCGELPCDMFLKFYDPALTEEEAEKSVRDRVFKLLKRKEIGTQDWLNQQNKA